MSRETDLEDMDQAARDHSSSEYSTDSDSDSSSDLGIQDATTQSRSQVDGAPAGADQNAALAENSKEGKSKKEKKEITKQDKKDLHRKQRGLMQWKPMRNLAFAKDEAVFAARKVVGKGKLEGREPTVESEY